MLSRRDVLIAGVAAAGAWPASAETGDPYQAALEAVFAETAPVALGGGVVDRDGMIWSGARGVRRIGTRDAVGPDDRWHLGSNTKAMTAALYARLVEQGRAEWDAPLQDLFDGVAVDPAWAGTTIRDLMRHRAGVKDADALGAVFFMTARADPRSLPEQRLAVTERVLGAAPTGPRGAFEYANANYMLAGAAIERITGRSWEEVLQAELFGPLGLDSAGFGAPKTSSAGGPNAWGHRGAGAARAAVDPNNAGADNPAALGPAGTVHMSLADYGRWLRLFLTEGDGWLKPDTVAALAAPGSDEGLPYALGWIAPPQVGWAGGPVLTHDGSNTLWYLTAVVAPARGRAYFAVSNQGDGQAPTSALIRRMIAGAG